LLSHVPLLSAVELQRLGEKLGFIQRSLLHRPVETERFENSDCRVLAFYPYAVDFPENHLRHRALRILANHNISPIFLGKTFQPGRQVHRVTHDRIGEPNAGTHVSHAHAAAVQSHTDPDLGPVLRPEMGLHFLQGALHLETREHAVPGVVRVRERGTPESHDAVPHVLVDRPAMPVDHLR
jgi:hypothetical protein